MLLRDLDQHDPHPVGVGDPHLDETPRLGAWCPQDLHTERGKPVMLGADVTHLQPQAQVVRRWLGRRGAGDLQETAAEEEHQPGIGRIAELAIHRKPEHVAIEPARSVRLDRAQQDTAGEHVHNCDDAAASDRSIHSTGSKLRDQRFSLPNRYSAMPRMASAELTKTSACT